MPLSCWNWISAPVVGPLRIHAREPTQRRGSWDSTLGPRRLPTAQDDHEKHSVSHPAKLRRREYGREEWHRACVERESAYSHLRPFGKAPHTRTPKRSRRMRRPPEGVSS